MKNIHILSSAQRQSPSSTTLKLTHYRTHHTAHRTDKLQYPIPSFNYTDLRLNHDLIHPLRTTRTAFHRSVSPSSHHSIHPRRRLFQSSPPRKDLFGFGVFSCSIPIFKTFLLSLTRGTLVVLPFWYRWKLARYFPRASRTLLTIPLFAMCLVIAIGIDQSPRTHRWRLLLMSEAEEMEWSHRRFEEIVASDGHLIVGPQDPRTQMVKEICDRLMTALDLDSTVSAAAWPRSTDLGEERRTGRRVEPSRKDIKSSAITGSDLLPWKPESSNPEKKLESDDWELFIIDLPRINAFVLPTKKIFVYTGLLELIKNSEELAAAVIAHEVSHVVERHSVENLGFSALSAVVFDAMRGISYALTISFPVVSDGLAFCINYLNDVVVQKAYSRKLETEADELGLMIMARAGYDPGAALKLWNLLNQLEEDQRTSNNNSSIGWAERIPWTRTHPTCKDRELTIQKALPKAMKFFQQPLSFQSTPAAISLAKDPSA
ncbi:hypothetical protein Pst134EA_022738 [Puccinia striiformis f. sp. tritici]|uniref:hypothetical protein n=1 Tax=Puccinia striiformis f. sp. tritici TaxID=168172 RepID=UPI00200788CB|nr:hypothetical protein Pst134EA_022738 [Puccinia striiformis f. sp. tritici]KAH9455264.1 hypothetical protein Pst134EA_022738 [Puccinia striiformis f. sp. tritici]